MVLYKGLLKVNIRQFEEPDFGQYLDGGEFDVDRMIDDYTTSQQGNENAENVDGEVDVIPEDAPTPPEDVADNPEGAVTPTEGAETPSEPEVPDKRTPDQAFAHMRRQVESYEPLAKWVQELATQQGFQDPTELIDAYQQRRIEKEAAEQGVPVDVYQRLHQLEQENKTQQEHLISQQFNSEVDATRAKYNLNEDQLTQVFQFMGQNGYDAGTIPFEDAYVLANRDTLIQQAEERGRQSYLETKRQQQQSATPNPGTGAADSKQGGTDLDYSSESILKQFENLGIPID